MSASTILAAITISELTWQAIIGGVVTIVLAWMQYHTRQTVQDTAQRAKVRVQRVKAKVEEVEKAVEAVQETVDRTEVKTLEHLESLGRVTTDTHTLVNSNMGIQLEAVARALREIANMRGGPGDEAAAEQAEQAYQDHESKQGIVDARDARREEQAKESE